MRAPSALGPLAAALLLIALAAPAGTQSRTWHVSTTSAAAVSVRAAPIARHAAREPMDGALADLGRAIDLSAASDAFAKVGDAASRLEAIAPTPRPTPPPPRAAPVVPAPAEAVSDVDAERRMLALINASRAAGGLVPLMTDDAATRTARGHSEVESRYGYVYHDGPDGTAGSRNVPACGNGWYGENTGKVWQGNVERLHVEFMSEPWVPINHRTNIMDPSFRRIGIGAVQGRDALYMTMVFCR